MKIYLKIPGSLPGPGRLKKTLINCSNLKINLKLSTKRETENNVLYDKNTKSGLLIDFGLSELELNNNQIQVILDQNDTESFYRSLPLEALNYLGY